nr:MAG TPA: tail protein [Caudoviricetes sp.]
MSSPIIFEKGTRDFSTLGLGLLSDAIQATTTEELNGQFIFEMDYPISGNNADLIKENRIIVVNSGHILKRQGFIIRQIVRKIDLTMTVYAEHVSYATLDVALSPIGTISGDAKTALENWKRMLVPAVDFTVDSDILTTNSTSIGAPEFETARQGLGGHAGSILDVWGGEYQFDNWHIRLLKQRGKSANAIIAYGRNLISFEQDTNIADTYTSVYPYYQENSGDDGNKTHFLPERTVDSEFVGKYPNPKVLMLDLSNKFKDVADYSETKLRNYALSYIQSNNIGVPKVNMKISTVDLSRATGGFSEDIDLGDTVNVYFEKLGITTSAKVIKAVWNVLSDDYDKFEIGARRASLTESISELATTADENANKALNQALVALQSADGKSTIYYLNSSDPWPTNPNENDTAFVKDGENGIMYRYMFNNDTGMFSWVKILDSMSADQIKQRVSDALESGKAYSDQLVADNVAQVNAVLDDVQAKQADLTEAQSVLDIKAQGYANKALADAKANTLATATQTAKDAQEYTDTAKAEAISVATTADGVINQKIDDTASSITRTISQNKSDADGKISTAQSTATQALDGLTQKVSQNTYDAKVNELTGKVSTAQQTADGAVTTIGNYKQYNDGRVASAESAIQQNATAITQKVSQTDYDKKTGELSGKISEISQTAGQISQSVSDVKAQVYGLSVGGRNLFQDSKGLSHRLWSNGATVTLEPFDDTTNMWHIVAPTTDGWSAGFYMYAYGNEVGIKDGDSWAFSADVKGTGEINMMGMEGGTHTPQPVGVLTSDWVRMSQTGVASSGNSLIMYFHTTSTQGIDAYVKLPKLEIGNLPTDWTPAPEDVDNKISTVSQTVDSISSIVSDPTTGLTKRIQTAEGSISTVQSNVSDLQSKQTQTANGLTTEISNRQTGDTNTLTQAKDFTTSSISNSESGMRSLITQTSDSIIAKVDTKTDSATVLSLLRENWSIGIADNAGALASGIAGDLNGMTLISKEITLDGNTTVTGDFYAKGGNFKNINASNITAGNLDADEVRIINLDVNTLTGDVSRFLETNWNGAYGSTKITSTGMKINTQYIQADFQGFGMDFSYSNKKIGGMGISQYLNGEPGLSMRLESNGAYMAWSARNEGDSTGSYIDKLAWYRQGKPALGGNYGFIFSDRVTFNKPINVEGASINLGFRPINLYGNNFPFFGNQDNITGFAYTSNEIYMVLQNQYVNLSNVIKALSGLGAWSVPTNIDSTGKVTQWRNVTT